MPAPAPLFAFQGTDVAGAANTGSQKQGDDAVMEITDCGDLSHPVADQTGSDLLTEDFQLLHARV